MQKETQHSPADILVTTTSSLSHRVPGRPALLHQDCKRFVREHCQEGSNPDYPWMQQIFTTLVTWSQLEQYLFPRLRDIWKKTPFRKAAPLDPDRNVFLGEVSVVCCATLDTSAEIIKGT